MKVFICYIFYSLVYTLVCRKQTTAKCECFSIISFRNLLSWKNNEEDYLDTDGSVTPNYEF